MQERRVTWGSVDKGWFLWDHKGLLFPRSALSVTPSVPSKSDFLELGGTNRRREECGREEKATRNTHGLAGRPLRLWEITRRNTLLRAQWELSRKAPPSQGGGWETISISLKAGRRNICFWGIFLSLVIISMFSEMKCLKTTTQHRETLFFSFETSLKNTACPVHHPWGSYLI